MAKIEKEIKDLTSTDIEPAAGATGAAEPAEPAAAETPPPPISKLHARMQGMGKNWKDDEDFYNQADDYVGELESFREKSQKEQQELMAIIDREPELAMILTDMGAGAPFLVALARHIDPADLTPESDDPDYGAWSANAKQRDEDAANRKRYQEEVDANMQASTAQMNEFAEESGYSKEKTAKFFEDLGTLFTDVYNGKITKELLVKLEKLFDFNEKIKEAKEEGLVEGKNAKIKAVKATDEITDNLPKLIPAGTDDPKQIKEDYITKLKKGTRV